MRFISVTKPGIIAGNALSMSGGFALGASGLAHWPLPYIYSLIGLSLVIASACVLNNLIDSDIDQLMHRTQNRVLVRGLMSRYTAFIYAFLLGCAGLSILSIGLNLLTASIAALGLLVYVLIYSLYAKRHTVCGTWIGGISGAIPPIMGYCASANRLDAAALCLFLMMLFWQVPHAYAIAMYRFRDYRLVSLPILPIRAHTGFSSQWMMLLYTLAFSFSSIFLTELAHTGSVYCVAAWCIGVLWTSATLFGFWVRDTARWARYIFFCSIFGMTILSLSMVCAHL